MKLNVIYPIIASGVGFLDKKLDDGYIGIKKYVEEHPRLKSGIAGAVIGCIGSAIIMTLYFRYVLRNQHSQVMKRLDSLEKTLQRPLLLRQIGLPG